MTIPPSHQLTTNIIEGVDALGYRYFQILPDERRIYQHHLEEVARQLRMLQVLQSREIRGFSGGDEIKEIFNDGICGFPEWFGGDSTK